QHASPVSLSSTTCRAPNHLFSSLTPPPPPASPLFPYTTLFRSGRPLRQAQVPRDLQAFLSQHRHALVELPRDHGKSMQVAVDLRSEEHTSELQSLTNLVCRLLLEKKKHNRTWSAQTRLVVRLAR